MGFILLVLLGALVIIYLRQIAKSRRQMDRLHQPPDDLRRADDNQPPPFDGSSGFV